MKRRLVIIILFLFVLVLSAEAIEQSLLLKLLELKRESYISKRGELYADLAPSYTQDQSVIPWAITKNSSANLNLNMRLGMSNRLQASLQIPYSSLSRTIDTNTRQYYKGTGLGDPSLSFQYELLSEKINRPNVYLVWGNTFPLGKSSHNNLAADELPTGSGYFSSSLGFSFLKSIDPCVVYWGGDYQWVFRRGDYDPGDVISYNGGIGVSLNQNINLSLGVVGAVTREDTQMVNGVEQTVSSSSNRTGLVIGSTIIFNPDFYLTPSIIIGATQEENDFLFSFGITRKLRGAVQ
jgi:hypothetical protein